MDARSIVPDILMDYRFGAATRTNERPNEQTYGQTGERTGERANERVNERTNDHYDAQLIDESQSIGIFLNTLCNNLIN